VVRASWLALLVGWAHTAGVEWLTALPQLLRAENKLAQLATARALGIDVPRTLSTSSTEVVHHVLGSRILVKPLGPGQYLDETGEEVMVPATILNSTDLGPEIGTCPFLFQEPLLARRHLRVVTVHDQAWATALPAEGLPVDWRLADHAHDGFVPADDPTTDRARAAAVRLASQLDVRFSSQDWIDTGDRLVFLDLNPAGQWLFLPEAVSAAVTESIAGWLGGDL
jgi:glutathione synthase/RimK-type ligase-like ATP-grasp enzyme